jgi:hypothetical protein
VVPPGPFTLKPVGRLFPGLTERGAASQRRSDLSARQSEPASLEGLGKLFARASLQVPDWTIITLRLPNNAAGPLTLSIDRGDGGRPDLHSQLTVDPVSGEMVRWEPFSSYNSGRQLRAWARFTHTGEAAGWVGETLAVVASAGRFPAGAYRALAWSTTAACLERAAGVAFGLKYLPDRPKTLKFDFSKNQFLVFSSRFSVGFAFYSSRVFTPCYNALPCRSTELLGPQRRISVVVLKLGDYLG